MSNSVHAGEGPSHLELSSTEIHVFVLLREALKNRCWPAREGELAQDGNPERQRRCCVDAYQLMAEAANGEGRAAWILASENWKMRHSVQPDSVVPGNPPRRSYFDDGSGSYREKKVTGEVRLNSVQARTILQLVADPEFLAVSEGALYWFPDQIVNIDFLAGMRRITQQDTKALIPGAHALTLGAVNEFMARWDSANFLHTVEGSMRALDFLTFARLASCGTGVSMHSVVPINPDRTTVDFTNIYPKRSASAVPHATKQQATSVREELRKVARRATRDRETIVLIDSLRQEYSSWLACNPSAAGGGECDPSFRAEFVFGRQSVMGRLAPAPSLALCLAAVDETLSGYVSPIGARLALAHFGLFLTARETFMIGYALRSILGSSSSMSRWAIVDILDLFNASALPDGFDGRVAVRRWLDSAKETVSKYLEDGESGFDNRELLRFLPIGSKEVLAAIQSVVHASLTRYRQLARFCCILGEHNEDCSGCDRDAATISLSNLKYAVKLIGNHPSSFLRQQRLNTLADLFIAPLTDSTKGRSSEKRLYWHKLLRRCSPLHALLAFERSHDTGAGGVDADEPKFDKDAEAVCSSFASWIYDKGFVALCREFEKRDTDKTGSLKSDEFKTAAIAAGYGSELFSAEPMRWVIAACHHHAQEKCISYAKYLAIILLGLEKIVGYF